MGITTSKAELKRCAENRETLQPHWDTFVKQHCRFDSSAWTAREELLSAFVTYAGFLDLSELSPYNHGFSLIDTMPRVKVSGNASHRVVTGIRLVSWPNPK